MDKAHKLYRLWDCVYHELGMDLGIGCIDRIYEAAISIHKEQEPLADKLYIPEEYTILVNGMWYDTEIPHTAFMALLKNILPQMRDGVWIFHKAQDGQRAYVAKHKYQKR